MTKSLPPSQNGHRVIYGVHAIEELLRRNPSQVSALFVQQEGKHNDSGSSLRPLLQKAQSAGIMVITKTKSELDRLSQAGVHQGITALCGEYQYVELSSLLEQAKRHESPPLFLLLDGVTDPQNLGALIRSASVFGVQGIIMPHDRSASVNATVVKTSSGATEWMPIARVPNLVRAMETLKEEGVWLFATALKGQHTKAPWDVDLTVPVGLVLGSEGYGLRPLVQKTCDMQMHIPMQGQLQGASLNVSACGAVLLYEVLRQRQTFTK